MAKGSTKLIDQSQALDSFFESLMRDVEAYEENEQQPHVEPEKEPARQNEGNVVRTELKLEIPEPVIEQEVEKKVDVRIFETLPPVAPAPVQEETIAPPVVTEAVDVEEQEEVATVPE